MVVVRRQQEEEIEQRLRHQERNPPPRDPLSIRIDKMREGLSPNNIVSKHIIRRVPHQLRSLNEAAYKPLLVSVGPYHHGQPQLQAMEICKKLCLDKFLKRRGQDVEMYVKALRQLEGEARALYEEPVGMDVDDFVEMMLLDGCFLVELICDYDLSPQLEYNMSGILRDLLLFENQLPFTVVQELFSLSKDPGDNQEIVLQAIKYFDITVAGLNIDRTRRVEDFNPRMTTLLGIVHRYLNLLPSEGGDNASTEERQIGSAIKLKEAGIRFTNARWSLRFEDGLLQIPSLPIFEEYVSILRNLIAYEQFSPEDLPLQVVNFAVVIQQLIAVPEDVDLLRREGIIPIERGYYDSDAQIVHIFQSLVQGVQLEWYNFSHLYILDNAMKFGSRQWIKLKVKCNRWMQTLWEDYFSSPWAFISFIAAVILLILTLLQTYYSILSYKK